MNLWSLVVFTINNFTLDLQRIIFPSFFPYESLVDALSKIMNLQSRSGSSFSPNITKASSNSLSSALVNRSPLIHCSRWLFSLLFLFTRVLGFWVGENSWFNNCRANGDTKIDNSEKSLNCICKSINGGRCWWREKKDRELC